MKAAADKAEAGTKAAEGEKNAEGKAAAGEEEAKKNAVQEEKGIVKPPESIPQSNPSANTPILE